MPYQTKDWPIYLTELAVDTKDIGITVKDWLAENVPYALKDPYLPYWNCCYIYSGVTKLRAAELSKLVSELRQLIEETITKSGTLSPLYVKYFADRQTKGVPYTNFGSDPYHISLVKEIINALWHGEQAAVIFELNQVPNIFMVAYLLLHYGKACGALVSSACEENIIDHAYNSMNGGNRAGMELMFLIKPHLDKINDHLSEFKRVVPTNFDLKKHSLEDLEKALKVDPNVPTFRKLGQLMGVLTEELNPNLPKENSVLTDVAATFPQLFNRAREQLEKLRDKAIKVAPELSGQDYQALQFEGEKVIEELKSIDFKSLYRPENLARLYRLINKLFDLYNAILVQYKALTETSDKFAKEFLYKAKTSWFVTLIAIADRLEGVCILNPGQITTPALQYANDYYQKSIAYLHFADFHQDPLACRILQLVDEEFTELRIKAIYENLHESIASKTLIDKISLKALDSFYQLIEDNKSTHLAEMPLDVKKQLIRYYESIRPYVNKLSESLDEEVLAYLHQPRSQDSQSTLGWLAYKSVVSSKNFIFNQVGIDTNYKILNEREKIQADIQQHKKTFHFQTALDLKLVANAEYQLQNFIKENSDINTKSVLAEAIPYESHIELTPINDSKSAKELLLVQENLERERLKLQFVLSKFDEFIKVLKAIPKVEMTLLSGVEKQQLRSLYIYCQPYIQALLSKNDISFNRNVCRILNPTFKATSTTNILSGFEKLDKMDFIRRIQPAFKQAIEKQSNLLKVQAIQAKQLAEDKVEQGDVAIDLCLLSVEEKEKYRKEGRQLIEKVKSIQKGLDAYMACLDENALALLEKSKSKFSCPYPDIDDLYKFEMVDDKGEYKSTPAQILAIKRLMNVVSYIESAAKWLSRLDNKSFKSYYVICMTIAVYNIYSIYTDGKDFLQDPYLSEIETQLFQLINTTQKCMAFTPNSHDTFSKVDSNGTETAANEPLKNIAPFLDFLYEGPSLVQHCAQGTECTEETKKKFKDKSKRMQTRLVSLYDKSNSIVAMIWSLPEIIGVFNALQRQVGKLSKASYQSILKSLKSIKTQTYFDVLSFCQNIEMKLCLKQGTISEPSMSILDEIFDDFFDKLSIKESDKFYLKLDISYLEKLEENIHQGTDADQKKQNEIESKLKGLREMKKNLHWIKQSVPMFSFSTPKDVEREINVAINHFSTLKPFIKFNPELYKLDKKSLKEILQSKAGLFDKLIAANDQVIKILLSKKSTLSLIGKLKSNQSKFIDEAQQNKLEAVEDAKLEYADTYFEDICQDLAFSDKKLPNLGLNYHNVLGHYIKRHKETIIAAAMIKSSQIEVTIKNQILTMKSAFDTSYQRSYLSLEAIYATIVSYESNINCDAFNVEEVKGAKNKLACLDKMKNILGAEKSAGLRISELAEFMQLNSTRETLSTSMSYSVGSWAWFVSWYETILSFLGIQKTIDEKLFDDLYQQTTPNLSSTLL